MNMSLAVAVLSGLNPFVVVAAALAWKLWASAKFFPRGCRVVDAEVYTPWGVRRERVMEGGSKGGRRGLESGSGGDE